MTAIEGEESLEAVAKAAIKAAYAALQSRPTEKEKVAQALWVVATDGQLLYGPFGTEAEAYAALAAQKIPDFSDEEGIKQLRKDGLVPTLGGKAVVLPMIGPLAMAERVVVQDLKAHRTADRLCSTCDHPILAHAVTTRSNKCSVTGCGCREAKKP